jgi:hypothetical protein
MQLSFQDNRPSEENELMFHAVRDVIIPSAIHEKIIIDNDLSFVPEVMPLFFDLAGNVRDDIYIYHKSIQKNLQFPIIQNCFCYCFSKGMESAFLWNESKDGRINFNYCQSDAIKGISGAQVTEKFSKTITVGMVMIQNVFCDFQDNVLLDKEVGFSRGPRWAADVIACGLYFASAVGLDCGLDKIGYA